MYTQIYEAETEVYELRQQLREVRWEPFQKAIEDIDATIARNTDNWKPNRIAKTDLAILRLAVAEMLYEDNIPCGVSINEAVNLAKKYGDDRSYAFINSVLSRVSKELDK